MMSEVMGNMLESIYRSLAFIALVRIVPHPIVSYKVGVMWSADTTMSAHA